MSAHHIAEYPFPELLHGVSSLDLQTPKQSPTSTPTKSSTKHRSPLRAEALSFVPSKGCQSPTRSDPQPQYQYQSQGQPQQQPLLSSTPQTQSQLHQHSQSQPHPPFSHTSPRKHHPQHSPLPPIPRVTLSRHEICLYFGMDDMIDEFYEDVVLFLEERPQDKSEVEALEFHLEFKAG
ncbi:hypothetical protein IFR04_011100, partial [Cadophora malorum]